MGIRTRKTDDETRSEVRRSKRESRVNARARHEYYALPFDGDQADETSEDEYEADADAEA